nr:tetratricopeptide repeat protein [Leucobacter exalbidus]
MLAAQGRHDEALEALNPGLAVNPWSAELGGTRAWLLLTLWRLDEAQQTFEQLLGAHPELHDARRMLSITLQRQGDLGAAERTILGCLAAAPHEPLHRLQYARVLLAISAEPRDSRGNHVNRGNRSTRTLRNTARQQVDQALALAAGDAAAYEEAAHVLWSLGKPREAQDIAARALAEAPEHAGLLTLHAGLVTANAARPGTVNAHQEAVHATEMGKLLATDPQHRDARTALFAQLWHRSMTRIDAPVYLIAVAAMGIMFGFPGTAAAPSGVALWWAVAGVFGGVQWLRYRAAGQHVARGFLRSIAGSRPVDRARVWGERATWVGLLLCGVVAFVVRDAVAVRWVIVAMCALVLLAFACSLLWQLGYHARARQFEGASTDRAAVVRLSRHRRELVAVVVLRCLSVFALWALFGVVRAASGLDHSRSDVGAVVGLAASGMVLSPLIGWALTWATERRARRSLDAAIEVGAEAKPPAKWSPVLAALVAVVAVLGFVGAAASIPVLPNMHDSVGRYADPEPPVGDDGSDGTEEEPAEKACSGRTASRVSCQLDRMRERANTPIEIPQIEIPEIPEVVISER